MRVLERTIAAALVICTGASCSKSNGSDDDGNEGVSADSSSFNFCMPTKIEACEDAKFKLQELQVRREKALNESASDELARISLAMNYQNERLGVLTANLEEAELDQKLSELESKYQHLTKLLEDDLKQRPAARPLQGTNETPRLDERLDQGPRASAQATSPFVYHPLEIEAVNEVFQEFGDLYIEETPLGIDGEPQGVDLQVTQPWAGFWYPLQGGELYNDDAAPLRKFDALLEKLGREAGATTQERMLAELLGGESWEGHCAAWATASVLYPEPTQSITIEGITFDVSDQKALLTKTHLSYPLKYFGIRYNGNDETDGTMQDLRPEAFHRLFTVMLGERQKPFLVDDDPSVEVWTKPLYRMRWVATKDPEIKDAYIVKAWPWMTRQRSDVSNEPTSVNDRAAPAYEYRLYVDPSIIQDGKFKVIAGEWINESRDNHPDSVMLPMEGGDMVSGNPVIDKNLDIVRQVVKSGE